ncbi:sigma-54 dependent transcriptional regulator [Desulfospira joergensenii]|uniref:sigma-54 dependent transcriptional regulator n=1 Tax=Desulfospira joergensenii TaxID=53329 RepID=UPI0003B34AF7|nr:sigma-54 dependent transcriptional regulator [Desulfospira joergensenii]
MSEREKNDQTTVLIVDDQYGTFQCLQHLIDGENFFVLVVSDARQGLDALKKNRNQKWIIITDLNSSGMGGGGFLHQARQIIPRAAFLIIGPLNAFLYQGKKFYEFSGTRLKQDINAILLSIVRKMDDGQPEEVQPSPVLKERFGNIIGRSRSINQIYRMIDNLKKSSATVLIQGESGTGKELIAKTIHQTSLRKKGPFVAVNCGAIPVNLIESELFGHERGAFTTAVNQRKGKFETAQGGTLFLDEIGELDKDIQVKLLRVLQEKEFQRVGGNRTFKTDVRIISATNKDLNEEIKLGNFREDLFYRLNVVPVTIPPLRKRREDILPLLEYSFEKIFKEMDRSLPVLGEDAQKSLLCYDYPGNVREVANIVERLSVSCPGRKITLQDLPEEIRLESDPSACSVNMLKELPDEGVRLEDVEKELILKTLKKTSGNKQKAAKALGITRRLLYLRLSRYADA